LNNNGNDASANGLNGTPRNSVGFSTDAKEGTHSLSTNGTNHYVDLNNPSALPWGSDPRSISVWAKTTTTSGTHTVVGYGHNISFKAMFIAQDGTSLGGISVLLTTGLRLRYMVTVSSSLRE
jgi:hypothetical protein